MEYLIKKRPYHALPAEEAMRALNTSREGLSDFEALGRMEKLGKNLLPSPKRLSRLRLFLGQFNSPLMYIIIFVAFASFLIGHLTDSLFIFLVILINTTVGFIQENKAENALEKLKKSVEFYCRVIRGGRKKEVLSENLAIGDIVELNPGDRVPADGRIISAEELKINEAMLTGEWNSADKSKEPLTEKTETNEMKSMVFMGTVVDQGSGLFVVTATGADTELGKISKMVKNEEEMKAPIQRKFAKLARQIGYFVLGAVTFFSFINFLHGENIQNIIITSIALVVSAVPEGMIPAITVVLILGMRRLSRQKALVRKLNSNETMGAITVICMDKTGTLTRGEMQVSHVLTGEKELLHHKGDLKGIYSGDKLELHAKLLEIVTLLSDAYIENPDDEFNRWIMRGRPTDKALLAAGINAGIDVGILGKIFSVEKKVPFSSDKKFTAGVYREKGAKKVLFFMGSPEEAIKRSARIAVNGTDESLTSAKAADLFHRVDELTGQGLRVLACSWKELGNKEDIGKHGEDIKDMQLLGFVAIKDPLRHDVKESIKLAEKAGIRPIIITGDHQNTARAVVEELGLKVEKDRVIEGKDLDGMPDDELARRVRKAIIFARVLPAHKIRIIKALQFQNEVVAMVGDGLNDAPAIKAADVGIAVGSATDITKEVSDIILLDNSFSVIVKAIEQGRLIFQNIRRVIIYLMADDFSELFLFFVSVALGLPFPLYPLQILWINVIEDGFPDIALTTEKDTQGLMDEKPRDPKEPILNRQYKKFMFGIFLVSGVAAFGTFYAGLKIFQDIDKIRTLVFALVAFDSLVFAYIVRSFKHSVFNRRIFSNQILNIAIAFSLLLLLAGIYLPAAQNILKTIPLGLESWAIIISVSFAELLLLEYLKKRFLFERK